MDAIMSELDKPVSGQDLADALTLVIIELVAALSPSTKVADEKLDDVAGQLLTMASNLTNNPRLALLIRTTAQQLIQTEAGAG